MTDSRLNITSVSGKEKRLPDSRKLFSLLKLPLLKEVSTIHRP